MPHVGPIGVRLPRMEDPRLLRGEGRYVGDLRWPRMLYLAFVRCPHGRARIRRIDLQRARAMAGVEAFAADDLPALSRPMPMPPAFQQPGIEIRTPSPLAGGMVRCAGEAVAAVLADDPYRAADAADAVEVEYEPLPAVIDPDLALREGTLLVHDDVPGNVAGRVSRGYGDIEGAFAHAAVTIEHRFRIERAAAASIEPRTVAAVPGGGDDDVAITLWDSTQAPHNVRAALVRLLDLPAERVRVIAPDVGGGFGAKGRFYEEEAAVAIIARHLQRPVLWQATRREDMLSMYQGRGLIAEAELAADADGRLRGLRVRLIQDCGAYLPSGMIVPINSAQHLLGPYHLPAADFEIVGVYTNKAPLTPLRGGGRELGVFVMERMLDHLARQIGMDPVAVRERNAIRPEEFPYDTHYPDRTGETIVYDSGDYPGCLALAQEAIGYDAIKRGQEAERANGRYRGVAVTLFLESTGFGEERARAEIGTDGRVHLTIGSPSTGQGHATTMPQMLAAYLGVSAGQISYASGDTGSMEQGTGTFGSRMAVAAGNATAGAAQELREKVVRAAADEMEAAADDLEIVDGVVRVRGVPDRGITLGNLAARLAARGQDDALSAQFAWTPPHPSAFAGGAHAALVEVDIETGRVRVERYVVVHDCGTVINPLVVDGQVHGGVVHGLGNALLERTVYGDDGRLLTDSFLTYSMPLAEDVPAIEVVHHESPSPYNPEGIKGAGEGGTIGALATIARAVEDALTPLHLTLNDLPLRSDLLAGACAPLRSADGEA